MSVYRHGAWAPFHNTDLRGEFARRQKAIDEKISKLSNEEVMANDESLLVSNLYEEYCFFPVVIHEEDPARRCLVQNKLIVHDSSNYMTSGRRDGIEVDGIQISCYYPFEGDDILFDCQASTFSVAGYPSIELIDNCVALRASYRLSQMCGEADTVSALSQMSRDIGSIRSGIDYVNRDVVAFNQSLRPYIQQVLKKRKESVQRFFNLANLLNVPVSQNEFASNHIPIRRKRAIQPIAHQYQRKNEYCISDKDYSDILSAIRHFCSTFEKTPSVYSGMNEEALRSVLMAHLNSSYNPLVTGETFRVGGKTDIQISIEEQAAFIAECKMWSGPSAVQKAIEQIDNYLTWRDVKTALIYFVRQKGFISILEHAREALKSVDGIVQVNDIDRNEFDCYYASKATQGQMIRIRVFLFNMNPGISKR